MPVVPPPTYVHHRSKVIYLWPVLLILVGFGLILTALSLALSSGRRTASVVHSPVYEDDYKISPVVQDYVWETLKHWIPLLDEDLAERTAAVRLVQRDTALVEGVGTEVRLPLSEEWFDDPARQVLFFLQMPETDAELMDEVFRDFFPQTPFEILRPLSEVFRLIDIPRPRIDIGFVPSRHMQALHQDTANRLYFSGYTDVSVHLALRSGRPGAAGARTVLMATMLREPTARIAAQLAFLQEWRFAREKPLPVDMAEYEVSRKIKLMQRRDELLLNDLWNGANWAFQPHYLLPERVPYIQPAAGHPPRGGFIAETTWQLEDFVAYLQASGFSNYQTNALAGALDGSASKREAKELLAAAKVNLDNFDFVGLHEEWQLSVALLRETFSLKGSWESRAPATSALKVSEKARAAIARTQANDIALYAYARELVHRRAEKFGLSVSP